MNEVRWRLGATAVLALGLVAVTASSAAAQGRADRGSLSVIVENDSLVTSDRNYTSGVKLSYLSGARDPTGLSARLARILLGADSEDRVRFGLSAGQSIFTPEDIETRAPLPDQHPYAGWLYAELMLVVEAESTLDTLALELGIVGPNAAGEWVQTNVHEIVETTEPRGWDNQLHDELGVVLIYDRKWRRLATWEMVGLEIDLTPNVGFSLGNVMTQAMAGLTFRIGQDLRSDYGPPRVRPSLAGSGLLRARDEFGWYVFAGAAGRGVAHNIFLDGNTIRDSHEVDRRPWVADFQGGIVFQLGRMQLGFTLVTRTKEFDTQGERQVFGALSVTVKP